MRMAFLLLSLLLPASCAHAASDQGRRLPSTYVEDLAAFARLATGRTHRGPYPIRFMDPVDLARWYYGEHYRAGLEESLQGVTVRGMITLRTDYLPGRDDGVLVHELVHLMQFAEGEMERVPCVGRLEPEAYAAGDAFFRATGLGSPSNVMIGFLQAQCTGLAPR